MQKPLIQRHQNGVPHIFAEDSEALNYGIGYAHAFDRGLQILVMRILGQGRASELLAANDETLAIDRFFRRMNWAGGMKEELDKLTPEARRMAEAYCRGVNDAFARHKPFETKLLGIPIEEYQIEHIFLISRMVGYLTLQQSQAEVERLFLELAQSGVEPKLLEELFPVRAKDLDVDLIKKIKLSETVLPKELLWGLGLPTAMASNNWVVGGKKTASGKPILANDPHLEVNRLPNVWHELVASVGEDYVLGFSMPGLPGVLVGRNRHVSWGATYTFMDATDSWIEKLKDGKYEKEGKLYEFRIRKEIIKRKKKPDIEEIFYENEHGTLDGSPDEDGYALTTQWSGAKSGARTLNASVQMWNVRTAKKAARLLGEIETSWNWVIADEKDIAYQMSGLYPKRTSKWNGFLPGLGWQKKYDWQGFASVSDLPSAFNPKSGFFVTANNDLNEHGKLSPINMPMGDYRARRIASLLESERKLTSQTFQEMHYDVYSIQAELFMPHILPHLPDSENAKILRDWDLRYNPESKGAWLFERIYGELIRLLFTKNGVPEKSMFYMQNNTGIFIDFYQNVDRILLASKKKSKWYAAISRDELFAEAVRQGLQKKARPWSEHQKVLLKHLVLGEKLPRLFGFDRGPVALPGGRATIAQGQVYLAGDRLTTFAPSIRFTACMAQKHIESNLAGGPSDRRFSKWYNSDTDNWLHGRYKRVAFVPADASGEFAEKLL